MRNAAVLLLVVISCVLVTGCRHGLAKQPLTPQQQEWAEKMDAWNWKWRLPYSAPVRASADKAVPTASLTGGAGGPALPLLPEDGSAASLPELPPAPTGVGIPAGGIEDVILVPIDGGGDVFPSGTVHTVKKGETLSKISLIHYGKSTQWRRIYEANRDKIASPDRLPVGLELEIPPAP